MHNTHNINYYDFISNLNSLAVVATSQWKCYTSVSYMYLLFFQGSNFSSSVDFDLPKDIPLFMRRPANLNGHNFFLNSFNRPKTLKIFLIRPKGFSSFSSWLSNSVDFSGVFFLLSSTGFLLFCSFIYLFF